MTFAITGVTGNTGKIVADALLARGKDVRVVVRDAAKGAPWKQRGATVATANLLDAAALTEAFRGVDAAYVLSPNDHASPNFRAHQDEVARVVARAAAASGLRHVVLLSSVGAQHPDGTGPIAGLHVAEKLLADVPALAVSSIRAGYFLENLGGMLGSVKDAGVLPSFVPAALRYPMTNTRDIARVATNLLLEGGAKSQAVELGTSLSFDDVAAGFGKILGKPVRVQEAPLDAVVPTFTSFGFSEDLASLYREMLGAIGTGRVAFEGGHRRVENTESLEQSLRVLLGL